MSFASHYLQQNEGNGIRIPPAQGGAREAEQDGWDRVGSPPQLARSSAPAPIGHELAGGIELRLQVAECGCAGQAREHRWVGQRLELAHPRQRAYTGGSSIGD
jgi:hypothetical protein